MATRMQQRRGTSTQWTAANPVLAAGEIGVETDTNQFKLGDGVSAWSALSYFKNLEDLGGSLDDYVPLTTKGEPGGVASLDADGLIPADQIPPLAITNTFVVADQAARLALDVQVGDVAIQSDTATTYILYGAPATSDGNWREITATAAIGSAVTSERTTSATLTNKSISLGSNTITGTVAEFNTALTDGNFATLAGQETLIAKTLTSPTLNSPTISNPAGLTKSDVGLGNVDNTLDLDKPISTATQSALDLKQDLITGVSNTEIGYLDGVTSAIQTQLNGKASSATVSSHTSATTSVHGIADTSLLATTSYVDSAVSTHEADTTGVHGIADTANLATKAYADGKASDAQSAAISAAATDAASQVSTHSSDTTLVHGIADTANLVTKAGIETLTNKTIDAASNTITVTSSNVSDFNEAAQDAIGNSVGTGLSYNDTTGAISVNTSTIQARVSGVSDTEIGYLDGVTSAIQTQLDAKLSSATAATTYQAINTNVSTTELGYLDGVTSAIQTQLDSKLSKAGGTMTGAITLSGAPTSDLHAATKLYVDNVTAGINFHEAVHAASTTNLATIYNNGTAGVGATLTADTNRAFATLDGESVVLGQRVLIKDQTDAKQNGIYTLTTVGVAGTTPWVLTRATDADNNPAGEIEYGDFCLVMNGTVNSGYGYINTSSANPIVIGTDNITYTAFNAAKAVSAGNGLQESTPGTLSIDTTVTQTRVANVSDTEIGYLDGVTSAIQTQLNAKTPELYTFVDVPGTTKTIATADAFKSYKFSNASAVTVTVPTHATDAIPVGTYVELYQWGGQITVVAATPATTSIRSTDSQTKSRTTYSSMVLIKVADNEWLLTGDLTA